MVNAYTDMPEYSIHPSSMSSFTKMCQAMVDLIDTGVPSNSEANENSAITKHWKPFCLELGTSWEHPNYADLNAAQRSTEDQMKAMFIPWCHRRIHSLETGALLLAIEYVSLLNSRIATCHRALSKWPF